MSSVMSLPSPLTPPASITMTSLPSAPPPAAPPPPPAAAAAVTILSKCTVYPDRENTLHDLPLSVSDLPMLSCHYIQKGLFFPPPPMPFPALASLLASTLSRALSLFPAFAGRLVTLPDDRIVISCCDAGVEFFLAEAPSLDLAALLPSSSDVNPDVKHLFPLDGAISYHGHFRPLAAFQLNELGDGAVFLGAAVNHAIVDGTSFWNFFNAWAELCRGGSPAGPDLRRNYFGGSAAVLRFAGGGGPEVTFPVNAPLRQRMFYFCPEAILELKSIANRWPSSKKLAGSGLFYEICGKQMHDPKAQMPKEKMEGEEIISSFQSLCAHLWRAVTRARKRLHPEANTTFRMAVNCRHRLQPKVSWNYFGNAIQSIPTTAKVSEVASRELPWAAELLHRSVLRHDDATVRRVVAEWEAEPRCFPLGNPDGAGVTMGSSHRFPIYEGNDFGWGRPVAVRSGRANKFDGKMSAFPGRNGGGSVELEVCLAPEAMAALLEDEEFMNYVS